MHFPEQCAREKKGTSQAPNPDRLRAGLLLLFERLLLARPRSPPSTMSFFFMPSTLGLNPYLSFVVYHVRGIEAGFLSPCLPRQYLAYVRLPSRVGVSTS